MIGLQAVVARLFCRNYVRVFNRFSATMTSASPTLSLDSYDAYGFDVDHTLAKYNLPNLLTDSYVAMANYLVSKKGYSADICTFDRDFYMRGLVLDVKRGNFMKLAEDGTVLRASHGTRFLSDDELVELFGKHRHWKHFEELIESVNNLGEDYWIFENFFDMAAGHLCARLIDVEDIGAGGHADGYKFWADVKDASNFVYHPKQFAANRGDFFPKFKQDTGFYVEPCSDRLKTWLQRLRKNGKKLFVVSSSHVDFATTSLQHILGEDWKSYFDIYVTLAKKPSFFTANRDFLRLEGIAEKEPVSELEAGKFYSRGNARMLNSFLAKITGKNNPKVLFFGDSMRSDVSPAKKNVGWDTVLVLEEMEAESLEISRRAVHITNDEPLEPSPKKAKIIHPDTLEKEFLTSRQWGSLFTDDHVVGGQERDGRRYMNTLWGYVIRKYADIAIPQLEYLTDLPLDHKFHVFNHELARKWGFYPRTPAALLSKHDTSDFDGV